MIEGTKYEYSLPNLFGSLSLSSIGTPPPPTGIHPDSRTPATDVLQQRSTTSASPSPNSTKAKETASKTPKKSIQLAANFSGPKKK